MSDDWLDDVAAGDFLSEVPAALRAEIDAAGEVVAYAQGYADGVGRAADLLCKAKADSWYDGFAAACQTLDADAGPCKAPSPARRRPLHGRRAGGVR